MTTIVDKEKNVINMDNLLLMRKTQLKDWLINPILSDRLSGTLKKIMV